MLLQHIPRHMPSELAHVKKIRSNKREQTNIHRELELVPAVNMGVLENVTSSSRCTFLIVVMVAMHSSRCREWECTYIGTDILRA